MDENKIIYSDETENTIFRVKDIKNVLEAYTHLPVLELTLLGKSKYHENLAQQPEQAWFFEATFQSSEGEKEAEVTISRNGDVLSVGSPFRPVLKNFKEHDRARAKENIPDLTRDYIEQLEQVGVSAWVLWKQLHERVKDDPSMEGLKGYMRMFRDEYTKVGHLLPDYPDR